MSRTSITREQAQRLGDRRAAAEVEVIREARRRSAPRRNTADGDADQGKGAQPGEKPAPPWAKDGAPGQPLCRPDDLPTPFNREESHVTRSNRSS